MRTAAGVGILLAMFLCAPPAVAASYVGTVPGETLGQSVAGVGDVNQDGYNDLLVGAPSSTPGSAYLFLGSPIGPTLAWSHHLINSHPPTPPPQGCGRRDDRFGSQVAGIGDIDGDGFADFAVAASNYDSCGPTGPRGLVQIYRGSANGPIAGQYFVGADGTSSTSMVGAGDVNGDGYDDVLYRTENPFRNPVVVVRLIYGGLASGVSFTGGPAYGVGPTGVGDVNGDGFHEIAIRAILGPTRLYLGSAAGPISPPALDLAGIVGSSGGDFNGDGFGDVVVRNGGSVWVQFGGSAGLGTTPGWSITVPHDGGGTYRGIGSAGDLDGDGDDEVLVGVRFEFVTQTRVFLGGPGGPETTPAWTIDLPPGSSGGFDAGYALGDFDGDGLGEVAVGDAGFDGPSGTNTGRVDVFGFDDVACAAQPDADDDGHHVAPCPYQPDCDDADATRYPFAPEICDGMDQDCDDVSDEDLGQTTCTDGPCSRTVDNCVNGAPQPCVVPPQSPEVCDGYDNDCDGITDNAPLPGPVSDVQVDLSQAIPRLVWTPLPGLVYGSVRGTLLVLNSTSGDYSIATDLCLGDGAEIEMSEDPPAGDGFWYLTHATNCGGEGTWDSGGPGQAASRDPALTGICP